jgi:hypothetical protein
LIVFSKFNLPMGRAVLVAASDLLSAEQSSKRTRAKLVSTVRSAKEVLSGLSFPDKFGYWLSLFCGLQVEAGESLFS